MTRDHVATRTLVKSPPELWAECSDAGSLARHIGEFGEITITRLEPETSVAWEGEHASGTVLIEPSGWGTRVTLTAQTTVEDEPVGDEPIGDEPIADEPIADEPIADEPIEDQLIEYQPIEYQPIAHEPIAEEEVEDADETVEEAVAEPDHALAENPGRVRRRWRRLIGRFRSRDEELAPFADEPDLDPDPELDPEPDLEPELDQEPEPDPELEPDPEPVAQELEPPPQPDPDPVADDDDHVDPEAILAAALESLGQAHHRPFSRA
jgi:hypothetical protein